MNSKKTVAVPIKLHYATLISLMISNITVLALATLFANTLLGGGLGYFAYLKELASFKKPAYAFTPVTDRHVFLDTNGDSILNDDPNPVLNSWSAANNTQNMMVCPDGRIIGSNTALHRITTCVSGSPVGLTNGMQADVDGDGELEYVYGHPQAAVYAMAKSDTIEVHAGKYRKAGAECGQNCGASSVGGGTQTNCGQYDCWFAAVAAFGYFADGHLDGYGTAAAPGYLRGAEVDANHNGMIEPLLGEVDTWDINGDKQADTGAYPAILSGDTAQDGDTTFTTTACAGSNCTGDAFHTVLWGCGEPGIVSNPGYGVILCRGTAFAPGEHGPLIDTNADGSFDTQIGNAATNPIRNVDYLTLKNIEFSGYNGGNGSANNGTARHLDSSFTFEGNGSTAGIVVDHIYLHDNDYSVALGEKEWAHFGEHHNQHCPTPIQIRNSLLYQNNEKMYVDDLQSNINDEPSSCSLYFHDNRVVFDWKSPRARSGYNAFAYFKPIHTNSKGQPVGGTETIHRIYNNEFIVKDGRGGDFFDTQGFGGSTNKGQLWFYGNIVRESTVIPSRCSNHGSQICTAASQCPEYSTGETCNPSNLADVFQGFCGAGTQGWNYYLFNNSFDIGKAQGAICNSNGMKAIEKNNAWFRTTGVHPETATTTRFLNEICDTTQTSCFKPAVVTRAGWFSTSTLLGEGNGILSYAPNITGPLHTITANNACDPDEDSIAGVDYNGDSINDTTWTDIAGNTVSCSSVSAPINIGAIQSDGSPPPDTVAPTGVGNLSPANGISNVLLTPVLQALTATDATLPISYLFELYPRSAVCGGTPTIRSYSTSNTWQLSSLNSRTLYSWRVQARDSANPPNVSAFGPCWKFSTFSTSNNPGGGINKNMDVTPQLP